MMLLDKTIEYFAAFSNKDIDSLRKMFSENICLRDWELNVCGIEDVVLANSNIFNLVEDILVTPMKLYQQDSTVIAEIEILINQKEKLLVTDIIEYSKDKKIKSIRAYKG